ncbi:MAG: phosphoribosyltransferase, partial [Oscillospiraceae bacterium]|nr:phosphoribosyltransferase [Oscillospiraceae bacterium]
MEDRLKIIGSGKVSIGIMPGHFATNHSHVNFYVDMTSIKTSCKMAEEAAQELAAAVSGTYIDTIVCLEGTEILAAFLARDLSQSGINKGSDISLVTPETNSVNQMIFRDNMLMMVRNKKVLILIDTATTGATLQSAIRSIRYYGGETVGISAIYSVASHLDGYQIRAL